MVRLLLKRGDQVQFLHETQCSEKICDTIRTMVSIYNGRLKVRRICDEIDQLREYGVHLPPSMVGLTDEQVSELHLVDEYADKCALPGGYSVNVDPIGRRNGRAPKENMQQVLKNTVAEAQAVVCESQANSGVVLTERMIQEAIAILRGAVMIAYPMDLPPYDPVRMELENREDLDGTQASREVMEPPLAQLWFSGKEMLPDRKLCDYVGANEKTRVVVKLQRKGEGAPCREPLMTADQQKQLMLAEYRRREELKKLDADTDQSHLNSSWADGKNLHRAFHGLDQVSWRPK